MARLDPLAEISDPQAQDALRRIESLVGYRPNALATMARVPLVLERVIALFEAVVHDRGVVPVKLKWLSAFVVSMTAGCAYSACHAAHAAMEVGEKVERIRAAMVRPDGPCFSEAERSVLELAQAIGAHRASDEAAAKVRQHLGEDGLAELTAVLALFGWFNRWNTTLATDLEQEPADFALRNLSDVGWSAGIHQTPTSKDGERR